MLDFIPWNSQVPEIWARRYAGGKFVDLDGYRTHYLEQGDGEPLLLVHGFFYDSFLWSANVETLARHFRVYSIDLWGWGYSTREALDYGYPLYARQLRLFLDALGIKRAILMGQSMGAGAAIQFSLENPERVAKLILVGSAGLPNPLPLTAKIFQLPGVGELLLALPTLAVRQKNLADFWIHRRELVTHEYVERVTRAQKIVGSTPVVLGILRRRFFDTLSAEIRQLREKELPILIVWGKEDRAVPVRCGEEMHRILTGSRLAVLERAGHVPNYDVPADFNRIALGFCLDSTGR
ncbi:MAG: alpha/beta hydrolase [Armatimonadetes bacterium]|nr:alpha/beta hydrolase [Armatimonadota bacterium]